MTLRPIPSEFSYTVYEENFILFFIRVYGEYLRRANTTRLFILYLLFSVYFIQSPLKVPKCEIFHLFDFNDFYGIKSLYVGDLRAEIKN